jgi:hypothetical protein
MVLARLIIRLAALATFSSIEAVKLSSRARLLSGAGVSPAVPAEPAIIFFRPIDRAGYAPAGGRDARPTDDRNPQ